MVGFLKNPFLNSNIFMIVFIITDEYNNYYKKFFIEKNKEAYIYFLKTIYCMHIIFSMSNVH